jgi:DNA-directed RNA polymerase specialized sigma subunit
MIEDEHRPAYEAWSQDQSPENTGALLNSVKPVLNSALKSYAGGNSNPVMQSRAKLLALEAFKRYDPTRAKLRTHLLSHLRGLGRFASHSSQIIRLPDRTLIDLAHMRRGENELSDELGRAPSTSELADHLVMSKAKIAKLRGARPGITEGRVSEQDEEGNEGGGGGVVRPEQYDSWIHFVHGDLHPTDQVIMEHVLGLHGQPKLSKTEIARKLNMSSASVSQRAAKIQDKLDLYGNTTQGLF